MKMVLATIAVVLVSLTMSCSGATPSPDATRGGSHETFLPTATTGVTFIPLPLPPTAPATSQETETPEAPPDALAYIGECQFSLEVAETPQERAQGLMHRASLPQDQGVLFVFPEESLLQFWMLNTLIPLDILFLNSTAKVVDVQRMVPEPEVPPDRLTVYTSQGPASYALEMNAGQAEACGIRADSQATLELGS